MGLFPTDANNLDEVTNANGTTFQYILADDKWIIIPNVDVYTEAEVDALLHVAVTVNAPIILTAQDIEIKNDVGAQITEIDTGVLSELDTTVPTSKTVFDAVAGGAGGAQYATGTYTGNGANNRQITGFGFNPTYIQITHATDYSCYYTYDTFTVWDCFRFSTITKKTNWMKLIADGFEVNNNEASDNINVNGSVYHYLIIGE